MNPLKKPLRILLTLLAALQLTACSKTVQWEEEVPLNTGETIWVKRSVDYTLQGGAGNPLDIAYRPDWVEKLQFEWGGNKYVYEGGASVILLAISPQDTPVLVAPAADSDWRYKHDYKCTVPFYVQLVPDAKRKNWTWPPAIEPWLFGLQYNLMRSRHAPAEMEKRITAQTRNMKDADGSIQSPSHARINPTFEAERGTCIKGN
jgi:hypothetical protein